VSLSPTQHQHATVSLQPPAPNRTPVLDRANGAAARALERIIERRYGALALCLTALLMALIVAVVIASQDTSSARAADGSARFALIHTASRPQRSTTSGASNRP
jgi:hypothetical protein